MRGRVALDSVEFNIGDAITLGGAVFFAIQMAVTAKYGRKMDINVITFWMFVGNGVLSLISSLLFETQAPLSVWTPSFIGVMASSLPAMFPTHIRFSALASAFNISVLIAGLTPTLAAWLVETTQNLMMPAYYLMVIAVVGMATGLSMKETANRPLKGATPAASDIQEAKEILGEHYDNIEQKIEDIDQEIADLQAKRSRLVQQHPRIND